MEFLFLRNVYRNILQRLVCQHFEKTSGAEFIRLVAGVDGADDESDPPVESASPHLVATLVDRSAFNYLF